MAGKGDKQRPRQVDKSTFDENWYRTFGRRLDQPLEVLTCDIDLKTGEMTPIKRFTVENPVIHPIDDPDQHHSNPED